MPKPKIDVSRLQLNEQAINEVVNLLVSIQQPFTMEISNYTTRIRSKKHNYLFMKQEQPLQVFAAKAKIEKDLRSVKNPPKDQPQDVHYYETNFRHEFYSDVVHNIDLKSAYASILYNAGFITGTTYEYIMSLSKTERLAAVGMIASRKEIYTHSKDGRVLKMTEIVNPLAPFFFFCVRKTAEIIHSLRVHVIKESFLFSWVDSIYYLNKNENYQKVSQDYLYSEYKIDSSFKELSDFELKSKNEFYKISYTENCTKDTKVFNIPHPESKLKKKIINYLLTKSYDTTKKPDGIKSYRAKAR